MTDEQFATILKRLDDLERLIKAPKPVDWVSTLDPRKPFPEAAQPNKAR